MGPQLREHDRVLVSRTAYRLHDPRRGDIVVFPSPSAEPDDRGLVGGLVDDVLEAVALKAPGDDDLIKRVIGLPGETISARDGTVVIDRRRLVEPYLPDTVTTADFGPVTIPAGPVFVLGDNRSDFPASPFDDMGAIQIGRAHV